MVLENSTETDRQRQFRGLGDLVKREHNRSDVDILAHRQPADSKGTTCQHLLLRISNIIGTAYGVDINAKSIIHLYRHLQRISGGIDELGELCQRHNPITELPPFLIISIALLLPMYVKRTFQSGPLPAIIVEGQQLETGIVLRTQVSLYFILITECLQLSTRHQEFLRHLLHSVVA